MYTALEAIERERMTCLAATLLEHGKVLFNIAYKLRPDIERLLFAESQKLNEWIIQDKIMIADLRARMLTSEMIYLEQLANTFEEREEVWRVLQQNHVTAALICAIKDESAYVSQRDATMDTLVRETTAAHARLDDRLHTLTQI